MLRKSDLRLLYGTMSGATLPLTILAAFSYWQPGQLWLARPGGMTAFNATVLKVLFASIPFGSLAGCCLAGSAHAWKEKAAFTGTWVATALLTAIFLYYIIGLSAFLPPFTLLLLYMCFVLLFVGAVKLRRLADKKAS